ncbi:MAG: M24 family metallopeptidase [candidate division Zixibacteria bacterium]
MDSTRLQNIQGELARLGLDGWLIYDFHGQNDIAVSFLELTGIITRRSFYFIPASGQPIAFIHNIEKKPFESLPGRKFYYSSYRLLEEELARELKGKKRLAMEYSEKGRLPYIGKVDAGTLELIRSFGVEVVTSADLVAKFDACLTPNQIIMQKEAAENINRVKDEAFALIKDRLNNSETITEYEVIRFIMDKFSRADMTTDHPPICAVGPNAGNPHYVPTAENCAEIKKDNLVLIDLWAKLQKPKSVFADITWMAYTGSDLPDEYTKSFSLICMARDAAIDFLITNWGQKNIFGYQVDDVCRGVIAADDQGNYFTHRTGHSIAGSVHGPGPNIDNLETEDRRLLMPGHLFSIEPGLYYKDFGVRTEIDVLIDETGPVITTQPVQEEIIRLFA